MLYLLTWLDFYSFAAWLLVSKNVVLKQLLVGSSPGSVLWLVGLLVNVHSDHILRNLRKPGETSYKIPTGKVFSRKNTGTNESSHHSE